MTSFARTTSMLGNLRQRTPLDRDLTDASVAEVIDTFYYSEDPTRIISTGPTLVLPDEPTDTLNVPSYVRRADVVIGLDPTLPAFEMPLDLGTGPATSYAGNYEQRTWPILRYNAQGVLDWRFGYGGAGVSIRDSFEILSTQTTRFLATGAAGERDTILERLHVVGPGGVDMYQNDHQVVASAAYETDDAMTPARNGAVVYRVERATGFWARTTNIVVVRFDDPADPNYLLREVNLLRGVGY